MAEGITDDGKKIKYINKNYGNIRNFVLANKKFRSLVESGTFMTDEKRALLRKKRKKHDRK